MGANKRQLNIVRNLTDDEVSKLAFHVTTPAEFAKFIVLVSDFLLLHYYISDSSSHRPSSGKLVLMSEPRGNNRVLICLNNTKIVSVHYPFDINFNSENYPEIRLFDMAIDPDVVRHLDDIADYFIEKEQNESKEKWKYTVWDAMRDLGNDEYDPIPDEVFAIYDYIAKAEPGYLRYDYDITSAKGHVHPLHHIDVNYHRGATFKYGLYGPIDLDSFEQSFVKNSEKMYLHRFDDLRYQTILKLTKSTPNKNKSKKKLGKKRKR